MIQEGKEGSNGVVSGRGVRGCHQLNDWHGQGDLRGLRTAASAVWLAWARAWVCVAVSISGQERRRGASVLGDS